LPDSALQQAAASTLRDDRSSAQMYGETASVDSFTVSVSMPEPADDTRSQAVWRGVAAVQAMSEALARTGIRVMKPPDAADVQVEIVNVLGADDGPIVRSAKLSQRVPERRPRVLIIRMSVHDHHVEFVSAERLGRLTAEDQAAKRIRWWVAELTTRQGNGRPPVTG
jgi:hypothetical protein